jgi:hypothetical protein
MKFGGTSVGSAARMRVACDLITKHAATRPVAAVVSAMSKITDLLLDTTRLAEADDQAGIERNMTQLKSRHLDAAAELIPADRLERVNGEVEGLVGEFQRIVSGMQMLGYRPARAVRAARQRASPLARTRRRGGERSAGYCHRRRLQQRFAVDGCHAGKGAGEIDADPARRRHSYRDRL